MFFNSKARRVMEYADVGSLLAYQQAQPGRRLSEGTTRWLFQQLVIGLDYAHQRVSGCCCFHSGLFYKELPAGSSSS